MSIVITVLDPKKVIQVSDTLVTKFTDHSVMSDIARKTILVLGSKAKFVVGWVGLAIECPNRRNGEADGHGAEASARQNRACHFARQGTTVDSFPAQDDFHSTLALVSVLGCW